MTIKRFVEALVICLAVLGFLALCIGMAFLALKTMQNYGIYWEIGVIFVGLIFLILACFGSKLFSDL